MTKCWIFPGAKPKSGYGKTGRGIPAHRAMWEMCKGRIPKGLFVCHKCDNPPCIRPLHLFLGTAKDNAQDRDRKGRGGYKAFPGESHWKARLNVHKVRRIRRLWLSRRVTQVEIGKQYDIGSDVISDLVNGRAWTHVKDRIRAKPK